MTTASNAPDDVRRVLVLAGTTAVGKTDVSIPLAESLAAEIINADSRQVYRELVIGTARPTDEQLRRVPHHFIAEKSIHDRWTAGDFARAARDKIAEIHGRGRRVVVVGGSMLYIRALLDGLFSDDPARRDSYPELTAELEGRGVDAMYAELCECDPDLASKTDPQDHHRILRGLSVWRSSGKKLSELQSEAEQPLDCPFRLFFLHADREQTYDRVNRRVIEMVEEGLVDEVRALHDAGLNDRNCNALRTHGYQEVFPYLRGECSREEMIEEIQKAVRHYVKRQLTWFRAEKRAVWIERSYKEESSEVAERIREIFEN